MTSFGYFGSVAALSLIIPLLAARAPRVRWLYKFPICMLLVNVLPVMLVYRLDSDGHVGSTFGVAMMFGLFISFVIMIPTVGILAARESP
jgi:hypothetical protein